MANYDNLMSPNMLELNDTYAVKILICYFLHQINRPLTPDQLTEIATGDGIINYFIFTEAMNQLLEAGTVRLEQMDWGENADGEQVYVLSELAKAGADDFKRMVPTVLRDKILSSGLKFFAKLKNEHDVKTTVTETERGYSVGVHCTDGPFLLMDLKLYAPDREQAELLREKITENPADFYAKILDFALENKEYRPEPREVQI